jgi:hypothetical protein
VVDVNPPRERPSFVPRDGELDVAIANGILPKRVRRMVSIEGDRHLGGVRGV